jgi:hypothetical protein
MVVFEAKRFCKRCNKETNHMINPEHNNKSCNSCCEVLPIVSNECPTCGYVMTTMNEYKRCPVCSPTYQDKEELEAYKLLLKHSFFIALFANDFFGYACADAVELDTCDLSWVIPIVKKYGADGINACMHYIRQQLPLQEYLTEEEHKAYKEIEELNPKVFSRERI